MAVRTYLEAIREGIRDEMRRDDRVMVFGEDVGAKGGVFGLTEGLQREFGEWRVMDSPLAESCIVGVCIGAALNGMRPIAEIQFQDFILPAVDQIISEAAKVRYRSNGDWNVPMVIRAPFGGGVHGALYHSQSLEAMFCHVPGLRVVVPSNPHDAKGMLVAAIRDPDPVLYFEHKRAYRSIRGEVPEEEYTVPLDRARVARAGDDIAVFTYGLMVQTALHAAERLSADGFSVEVVDLRSLRPLDRASIVESARRCGKVLIAQEANLAVSVSSEVAAIVAEECFEYLDAPVMRIGGPEVPAMPFAKSLEDAYLVDVDKLEAKLRSLAEVLIPSARSGALHPTEDGSEELTHVALTVSMPQLGESVTEGTIAHWLKKPGEPVAQYESLAEVASDKVNAEIPAPADGTFGEIIAPEGSVVTVGQPICTIEQAAAGAERPGRTGAPATEPAAAAPARRRPAAASPAPRRSPLRSQPSPPATRRGAPYGSAARVSPRPPSGLARVSAAPGDNGAGVPAPVALTSPRPSVCSSASTASTSRAAGTGIGGRITKKDVLAHVQRRGAAVRAAGASPARFGSARAAASLAHQPRLGLPVPAAPAIPAPAPSPTPPPRSRDIRQSKAATSCCP